MKRLYGMILIAGLAIIGFACKKELSYAGVSADYVSLSDFFEKNQSSSELFVANAASPISIETKRGTKILFEPNSFVTMSGQPVTGNISFEIKEILNPAEMILSCALPMSNGEPLESGGEFLVKPTQNGQELKLAAGYFMMIKLPAVGVDMTNMQVFNGQLNNISSGSKINWALNSNPGNSVFSDSFTLARTLFSDSINWINCDRFLNEPKINYAVYPGNVNGFDSICVVVHFTGRNAVISIPWDNNSSRFYSQSVINSPATIVGIGIKNGKLQASIVPIILQNDQSVTLSFSPITEAQLKEKLSQLH